MAAARRPALAAPRHTRWAGPLVDGAVCSLGYDVAAWIVAYCCHGEGDLHGQPPRQLSPELLDHIVECYRIDPVTGRRVFNEAVFSAPKGFAKSELAAWITLAEAFGPVRFGGWDADGQPVAVPVVSPLIKCLATEEGQTGNTFKTVAFVAGEWGPDNHPEVYGGASGVRRYQSASAIYLPHGGEIRACTSGAASKDGGLESHVVADEALAVDTPLPTPTGWTTMGAVRVGDHLIGSDGLPTTVIKVTDVADDRVCWRVTFDDGTSIVASDGHLWLSRAVMTAVVPRVRTTGEMAADGRRFRVPRAVPLKSPDVALPIDPYVLGVWLGDGDARNATVSASAMDVDDVARQIESRGYTAKRMRTRPDRAELLYVSLPGSHRNRFSSVKGLKVRLREQGLITNKHIPVSYLRAGTEQRVELLRGLMDTDGHVSKHGSCVFVQTDRGLVDDVVELLRSLGQTPHITWRADPRSRAGGVFKVSFTPHGIAPVTLPRKVARLRPAGRGPDWTTIRAIEPAPSAPVRCVAVDAPDHLFVAGDGWKITHNTHLYVLPELRAMYATVARNMGKRFAADPWLHQTTTMFRAGEDSIAEQTLTAWRKGTLPESVHVTHREARGRVDLDNRAHTIAQLRQVYGSAAAWIDLDRKYRDMRDPRVCRDDAEAARYFLNRGVASTDAWIATDVYERQTWTRVVEPGEAITIGFDGSLSEDSTVLRGCCMSDGYLFKIGVWEKPDGPAGIGWEVPRADVLATFREAFATWDVVRAYCDPHEWRSDIDALAKEFGERVVPWRTDRDVAMAYALDRLHADLINGEVFHDADPVAAVHYGNAYVRMKAKLRLVRKERPGSPRKIDTVVGDALAYEARGDALANGWTANPEPVDTRVIVMR